MFLEDKDLVSIQEVRNLIRDAKKAQAELAKMSQEQIEYHCKSSSESLL